ncbi:MULTISPECIES: protein-glutamate O-methyltransferase CheR [unclassified Haladaptatus]|uniref:CheR family methyltransferase n=1 Tax=unclassified Haladaptatus TaxID=2622732 RepID=UPI00209BDCDE|nr:MULTISPECIES: protein-glutamate O-methyltransferase CheR [unclassified Haladaptatus]MCO8245253.1 protein-glutamate O-methyltransferase CheR [Haladaptatus sp. AB643]MCO8253397.1 protein-glutamate O-methyltransferase CheR [Haladaptatus sp. AB618]
MNSFDTLLSFIESELGFATSHYDSSYLDRRVSSRMRRTGIETYDRYRQRLETDADERTALLDALSVNVTSFFRNPDVWAEVRRVLRSLTDSGRHVKLWSAACSDGREPYSLALLAFADSEIDETKIRITATDIDREVLAKARRGVYRSTRTTDIAEQLEPLEGYERFVQRDDTEFRVPDRVKRLVEFERHDLIHGRSKSDFDFVSCRNLFIYINAEHKLPMLQTITDSLRTGGYLVIGKTETLPDVLKEKYDPIDKRLRIYKKSI